jgi:cytochrome c oxidase subunit 1
MKPKKPIDMSSTDTLMNGEQGLFKPKTLTPNQKLTLRFVVVGLVYYLFLVVGIFGSTYSIVCGAFLFLVPFLM